MKLTRRTTLLIAALFLCNAAFCDEAETPVPQEDVTPPEDSHSELVSESTPEDFSFTEEEIINDDISAEELALLELLKAVVHPEIEPLDTEAKITPHETQLKHNSFDFITDEEFEKPQVERFRKLYLSPKWSALLRGYLESAMEYRLYVRKAVADKDMPRLLEYLPVVESNYKTNAKSRSGAIGMWQFMANSVWPFLTLNDFVDERLDPWKSTDAALRKLTDNYNVFNDWLLAIGAYNCGVGAMNKAIKKAGGVKDFWYLAENGYLSKQTAEYVPKLIAIADLAINSEYYGINIPNHKEEYEILENEKNGNFDYVTVKKAYSINQLAQEMRLDASELKKLNPSFTMGMTHPSRESQIRLPLGMKESAQDALANMKPVEFPMKYTVVAGDSLWSISRKYKTTVQAICELNGIKENAILKIGKILYIPSK